MKRILFLLVVSSMIFASCGTNNNGEAEKATQDSLKKIERAEQAKIQQMDKDASMDPTVSQKEEAADTMANASTTEVSTVKEVKQAPVTTSKQAPVSTGKTEDSQVTTAKTVKKEAKK